jgi:phage terminase large subunit GpA-like protein
MLVVQPTVDMGEAWSKDRLAPMLRDSPALRGLVSEAKSRSSGNTLLHKVFAGGHLTIAGANSAASLASRPIRVVLFDEVDRYPPSAGTEGDPVTLGKKRSTTFWNRKSLLGSTPTISGKSRIEAAYEASDKRRYWVPCPHCGEFQTLKWAAVRWDGDDPATALMHCVGCGVGWTDAERYGAVRLGEWRAEAPFGRRRVCYQRTLLALGQAVGDGFWISGCQGAAGDAQGLGQHGPGRDLAGTGRGAGVGASDRAP